MNVYIDGFGLAGYRSFGNEIQRIGPFNKLNFFVGQNNSGKSNILLFLTKHYSNWIKSINPRNTNLQLDDLDRHRGNGGETLSLELAISSTSPRLSELIDGIQKRNNLSTTQREWLGGALDRLLKSDILRHGTELSWIPYRSSWPSNLGFDKTIVQALAATNVLTPSDWQSLWNLITGQGAGDLKEHWIPEVLRRISPENSSLPPISLIPAIRSIGDVRPEVARDYSGLGIIDRLAKFQNPGHRDQHLKNQFSQINDFLRTVTGNPDAELEIPYNRDMVLVHMNGKTLPLSSLGTGIHEVVILASAATVLNDQIVCIEEPELHMHPTLQRKLIQYLQENTTNQYFITTHSAHILDNPNVSIFHVQYEGGASFVEPIYTAADRYGLCADLGYRASDLLQTNCIIWVEGPSDRIYLNYWIKSEAPKLIEGLHYSIMFYGGRLLNHLTADDPEIHEFISLRRLNRNLSIVMDSDRKAEEDGINQTKQRISSEFETNSGIAWITAGREIENYIPRKTLEEAIKAIHNEVVSLNDDGQFDDPLAAQSSSGKIIGVDKVKVAREVTKHPIDLDSLDLRDKTKRLVDFIQRSNS